MRFASACRPFIERAEKVASRIIERAVAEEKNKTYINVVSEVKAFITNFKRLLSTLKTLEELYPDLKYGRMCFRWIYAENSDIISLVRLESGLSMLFTGDQLRISYDGKSISLSEALRLGIIINQYNDTVNLENEEEVTTKRSIILDVIATINSQIEKAIENLGLCIKYSRFKVS